MAPGTDQTLKSPQVLLTGASSQIGVFVLPRLVAAGFRVIAVSRKGKPEAFPRFEQVEWLTAAEAVETAGSCRYLLSAGPLQLARDLLQACREIKKAVVFSSSSVDTKQASGSRAEREQMRSMLAVEAELRCISEERDVKLLIFRPTLIYGCGLDTNISRLAGWISRFGFMPVNGAAQGLRQPVHADDLAKVSLAALLSKADMPDVLYLPGGEILSYSQMVSKIFVALGKPVRLLRLPQWLFVLLVKAANILKTTGEANSEMVRRQRLDLVFDDRQARQLLGYDPRPFSPILSDFHLP
jgi:nucleoside-diphosphate-sugar epimerase